MGKTKRNKADGWKPVPMSPGLREQGANAFDLMARYNYYYNRILDIYLSRFEYHNLPDTVDPRYAELSLITTGQAIYFKDPVIGEVILKMAGKSDINQYGVPLQREAYSDSTKYLDATLDETNSVVIYNNYLRYPAEPDIVYYARELAKIDMSIDLNLNAQKTPLFINVKNTAQAATMRNIYNKYDGNVPVIFADNGIQEDVIKVMKTDAPFLAPQLYEMKRALWNEVLTLAGVASAEMKKERVIVDEMNASLGSTRAARFSPLAARNDAFEKVNKMFGHDIYVTFRGEGVEDYNGVDDIPDYAETDKTSVSLEKGDEVE